MINKISKVIQEENNENSDPFFLENIQISDFNQEIEKEDNFLHFNEKEMEYNNFSKGTNKYSSKIKKIIESCISQKYTINQLSTYLASYIKTVNFIFSKFINIIFLILLGSIYKLSRYYKMSQST